MAQAKKAQSSAKRAPKSTKKVASVSKNASEMQGKNPKAKEVNAQAEPQGAVKTRFQSTKELLVSGLTKSKEFIVNCFNGAVDFIKAIFESITAFVKGLFSREQWKDKSAYMKNIFNVIALVAVVAILGQMAIAAVGWNGLALGAAGATVISYVIHRAAMTPEERETSGKMAFKDVLLPVAA